MGTVSSVISVLSTLQAAAKTTLCSGACLSFGVENLKKTQLRLVLGHGTWNIGHRNY